MSRDAWKLAGVLMLGTATAIGLAWLGLRTVLQ